MRMVTKTGLDSVAGITELLQRVHLAHPTGGLFQAAELQFWWSRPRHTDAIEHLFWLDDNDRPIAATLIVDFNDATSLLYDDVTFCPIVLPGSSATHVAEVVDRGLAHAAELGFASVELEVAHDDELMRATMIDRGFEVQLPEMLVECRVRADARAPISPLADGYRLTSRAQTFGRPHHMTRSADENFDERLAQLSLYDPTLDLVVLAADDTPAANGMFWFDPVTETGVVEPMRTADAHQQRGLGRHVLTSGLELLARAGAREISIGYGPDNIAAGDLYRSVGFEPVGGSALLGGPTRRSAVSRSS